MTTVVPSPSTEVSFSSPPWWSSMICLALLRAQLAGLLLLQDLHIAADRGQWRPQLVAHGRQEVGLLAVERLDPVDILLLVHLFLVSHDGPRHEPGNRLNNVGLGRGPDTGLADHENVDHPDHPVV